MQIQSFEKPFPHIIVDDFLADDIFSDLCEVLADLPMEYKESDLFSFEQSQDLTKNKDFQNIQEQLLALIKKNNFGVTVSRLDMMAACYSQGDHLLPHDDRLDSRKIAYTFYVTEPEAGGELSLITKKPPFKKTQLQVKPNRLVLFLVSKDSWHEVEDVQGELPRISITGWFH